MWSIGELVNTVEITKECAKELFEAQGYEGETWDSLEQVEYKGKLVFNSDHFEHMDFLATDKKVVEILKKHKVKGDICFGCLEGYNAGQFWGHRFDGKGGMVELVGKVVYEENRALFRGMTFVITGTLSGMTRDEAHGKIRELGGEISDSVSKNTTHLVLGEKHGSKLEKAKRFGITIWSEEEFKTRLGVEAEKTATSLLGKMPVKEKREVLEEIESDGFEYTFVSYSDFDEIKDEKFHQLRKAYLVARKALAKYVGYKD